ncbi:MAG: ABC transporter substrate-binding protein, partial [Dehalococcoidia bacterium]|nr:ABC transporter substrate-binding protein [Dehalococcoidia bacterium]
RNMEDLLKTAQREMDRRTFLKLSGATGALLVVAGLGCQPAGPKQMAGLKGAASGLNSFPALAPIQIALAKGFFEQEGLKSEWTEFAGGGDTIRAVTTGGFHVAEAAWSAALTAFQQGEPVRVIASGMNVIVVVWMVPVNSPLKSMKDIKGKKLSISRAGSVTHTALLGVLKAEGMSEVDVQIVATGGAPETWTAAKTGVIDVAWSSGAVQHRAELSGEARVIARARDYIKNWMDVCTATTVDTIKQQPELLRSYLKAKQKAMDFIAGNPEEAGRIWAKVVNLDEAYAIADMKVEVPKEAWTLKIDAQALTELQDQMVSSKQLSGKVDVNTLVDQSFLPENLRVKI